MDASLDRDWLSGNQRTLATEIARVRALVAGEVSEQTRDRPERAAAAQMRSRPAVDALSAAFALSTFERDVLLLCAGMELDSRVAVACGAAQADAQRSYPTFGLALSKLPDAHWNALLPTAPLRRWHLVELAAGGSPSAPLTTRPLKIDERVLHHLTGLSDLDERLAATAFPVPRSADAVPSHKRLAERVAAAWSGTAGATPVVGLYGPDLASAKAIAADAADLCGMQVYALHAHFLPSTAADLDLVGRLWAREMRLGSVVLLVECDTRPDAHQDTLRHWLDRLDGPVVVVGRERQAAGQRPMAGFEVGLPTPAEQRDVWHAALQDLCHVSADDVEVLTSQFSLSPFDVRSAIEEARHDAGTPAAAALWRACRHVSRGRLDELAQRIESSAGFDDLVLPESQKQVLADIAMHVRNRSTVHGSWGFAEHGSRGLGISALFAGPSGTGKTLSAEVLANILDLDLFRIDLSSVVSKYIGETEKNLRRIFDAADGGGVILLFDEADALFGKRSEVKDSHDRYANIEVSYLLQRMESYRGLAILTTNLRSAVDAAFLRRIRFVVQFPFPDAVQRAEIWRRVFPKQTPTLGLDVDRLAQLSVAGGSIRNVALNAAFLAADTNQPVGMSHLLRAARSECAKLEKSLTEAEVAGWV
jgi:AAA+ superfamily predicted ATPase